MKAFFDRLFGSQKDPRQPEIPTRPIKFEASDLALATAPTHLQPPQLVVGCGQSVGQQRDHNEDAMFMLTTTMTSDHTNLPFGLYVVADGMGGHQHGEVASGVAVRAMANYVIRKLYTPMYSIRPALPQKIITGNHAGWCSRSA